MTEMIMKCAINLKLSQNFFVNLTLQQNCWLSEAIICINNMILYNNNNNIGIYWRRGGVEEAGLHYIFGYWTLSPPISYSYDIVNVQNQMKCLIENFFNRLLLSLTGLLIGSKCFSK